MQGSVFCRISSQNRQWREGRLFRLPVKELEIEVWKQLLYHRDKWISPQVESVLQYCLSHRISIPVD